MPVPGRGRPPYPEHALIKVPDVIYLDVRCKGALVVHPAGLGYPHCDKCGNVDATEGAVAADIGIAYIRADLVKAQIEELVKGPDDVPASRCEDHEP